MGDKKAHTPTHTHIQKIKLWQIEYGNPNLLLMTSQKGFNYDQRIRRPKVKRLQEEKEEVEKKHTHFFFDKTMLNSSVKQSLQIVYL